MAKIILITGATDGIGFETAKILVSQGHHLLIHGRNPEKLHKVENFLAVQPGAGIVESYVADLSYLLDVEALAVAIAAKHQKIDVLINNAGVYKTTNTVSKDGLDVRFAVNSIAPYLLSQRLLPLLGPSSRVVNLSSAAQASVNLNALAGNGQLSDGDAYAQSKLALTMWSTKLGLALKDQGTMMVAVNPGSLLGSKMVKEAYGISGGDLSIGADILVRAALSAEFSDAYARYYDNDAGRFATPHPDALDATKNQQLTRAIEAILTDKIG